MFAVFTEPLEGHPLHSNTPLQLSKTSSKQRLRKQVLTPCNNVPKRRKKNKSAFAAIAFQKATLQNITNTPQGKVPRAKITTTTPATTVVKANVTQVATPASALLPSCAPITPNPPASTAFHTKNGSAFTPTIIRTAIPQQKPTSKTDILVPDLPVLLSNTDFQNWLDQHVYALSPVQTLQKSIVKFGNTAKDSIGLDTNSSQPRPTNPMAKTFMAQQSNLNHRRKQKHKTQHENRPALKGQQEQKKNTAVEKILVTAPPVTASITAPVTAPIDPHTSTDTTEWSSGVLYGWVQHYDVTYEAPYYYNVISGESVWEKPMTNEEQEEQHIVHYPEQHRRSTLDDAPPSPIKHNSEYFDEWHTGNTNVHYNEPWDIQESVLNSVQEMIDNDDGSDHGHPSPNELQLMLQDFPNWASVFEAIEMDTSFLTTTTAATITQPTKQTNQDAHPRAWRKSQEPDPDPITSSAKQLRTSYDQYWEDVRSNKTVESTAHQLNQTDRTKSLGVLSPDNHALSSTFSSKSNATQQTTATKKTTEQIRTTIITNTPTTTTMKVMLVLLVLLVFIPSPVRDYLSTKKKKTVTFQTTTTFVPRARTTTGTGQQQVHKPSFTTVSSIIERNVQAVSTPTAPVSTAPDISDSDSDSTPAASASASASSLNAPTTLPQPDHQKQPQHPRKQTTNTVHSRQTIFAAPTYVPPTLQLLHPDMNDIVSESKVTCQIKVMGTIETRTRLCLQLTGPLAQTFCTEPMETSAAFDEQGSETSRILPFELTGMTEGKYTLNTLLIGPRRKLHKSLVHFEVRLE